jgi:Tfp pilus assembly protein PilF
MDRREATGAGKRSAALALALVAGVLAIYGQTLGFEFVAFDDDQYVTANRFVREGVTREGLRFAFSRGELSEGHTPHPLTWLSLMLDAELYGDDAGGFHATNVVLHALSAVLLFAALQGLTGSVWRSAAAAALWAWHPLRVESVAWVAERKDVLSAVFAMLTLWCYAHYARQASRRAWWGAVLSFAIGLLSKPSLVPLPFALLLLDYWPLRRGRPLASLCLEKWPLFLLSLLASLLTLDFHRGWTAEAALVSPLERAANAVVAVASYLEKLVWPSGLVPLYPHPYIPQSGGSPLALATVVLSTLLVVVVTAAVLRARQMPQLAVGWLFFLGMLAPTLGIVQVGHQAYADRYTHLPSIGLAVAVVWSLAELASRVRAPIQRRLLAALALLVLLGFGAVAFAQTRTWRNSEALFEHALRVTPRAKWVHYNLADWLRMHRRFDEAIEHYRVAVEVDSGNPRLRFDLGRALHARGRVAEAIEEYRLAARIDPTDPQLLYQLGVTYEMQGRLPEAIEHYRTAARLDPENPKLAKRLAAAEAKLRVR